MKARLNSRQRRRNRCGFKGEGSHKWVKTTPVGKIEHEAPDPSIMCALAQMRKTFKSKHQGSKPLRILRQFMN